MQNSNLRTRQRKKPVSWICKNLFIIIWSKSVFWPATYYYGNLTRQICRIFICFKSAFLKRTSKVKFLDFFFAARRTRKFFEPRLYLRIETSEKKVGEKSRTLTKPKTLGFSFLVKCKAFFGPILLFFLLLFHGKLSSGRTVTPSCLLGLFHDHRRE